MEHLNQNNYKTIHSSAEVIIAVRTAFVAKFILLREGKRSKAHRDIEKLVWNKDSTAEQLYRLFRESFKVNGDKLPAVDRDLKRALQHASGSANFFITQYLSRQTLTFKEALQDYERSNELLFGSEEAPTTKRNGWRQSAQLPA